MNPNHFLAAAIFYLFTHRPDWPPDAVVGKTVVSSSIIDRVAAKAGRALLEVPVGFKWFVAGLLEGSLGFGGEESAGASFLRRDGTVWTTDKDGIIMTCWRRSSWRARAAIPPSFTTTSAPSSARRCTSESTPRRRDDEKALLLEVVARRCQGVASWLAIRSRRCSRPRPATARRSAA